MSFITEAESIAHKLTCAVCGQSFVAEVASEAVRAYLTHLEAGHPSTAKEATGIVAEVDRVLTEIRSWLAPVTPSAPDAPAPEAPAPDAPASIPATSPGAPL